MRGYYEESWGSPRVDRFSFEMLSPNNLEDSYGELHGVVLDGTKITMSLDSDVRMACELSLADTNYIDNAAVRIHHYVDTWGYHAELGTFIPVGRKRESEHNKITGSLTMQSPLCSLIDDKWAFHYACGKGRSAIDVIEDVLSRANLKFTAKPNVGMYEYPETNVYVMGDTLFETASEAAANIGCELSVDGKGTVIVQRKRSGYQQTPYATVGAELVIGAISSEDITYTTPNRFALLYKDANGDEFAAFADATSRYKNSQMRRGHRLTEVEEISDLAYPSVEGVRKEAEKRLSEALSETGEATFQCAYMPLREGDAITFTADGNTRKCQISVLDVSLAPGMPMNVTMREVQDAA